MALANYNSIVAMSGSYVIRFNATANYTDLYENNPPEGTLLSHSPSGMFTDTSVYWIERVRGDDGGVADTDALGSAYIQFRATFHRGGSAFTQSLFLPGLDDAYSWVIINEDTEEYNMWPADGGQFGSGFAAYNVIPTYINDSPVSLVAAQVSAIAQSFIGGEGVDEAGAFEDRLLSSEVVVALIPSNTWRPSFAVTPPPPTPVTFELEVSAGTPQFQAGLESVATVDFGLTVRAGVPSFSTILVQPIDLEVQLRVGAPHFNIGLRSITVLPPVDLLSTIFPYPYTPIEVQGFQIEGLRIPVTDDPRQTIILTPLTAEPAVMQLRWAPKLQSWYLDLYTIEQVPISVGISCTQQVFLLNNHNELFRGNLYIDGPLESEPPVRAQWYPDGPFSMYYISERNYLGLRRQFPWL